MLALAFTLAILALIAFVITNSITQSSTKVILNPAKLRGFKKDELTTLVALVFKRARWVNVNLSSVTVGLGTETKFELSGNSAKVAMSSPFAGSFSGIKLEFVVTDILGLFSKRIQTVYADFTFDSLPLSILTSMARAKPLPLALGEKSGRSPGSSLELYSIEDYQPFSETKNVMWKKVARMTDERLVVRIRDSSIPAKIKIGFLQTRTRYREDKLHWMDLSCEAIGMVGNSLLASGCALEIIHGGSSDLLIAKHLAAGLDELADALMNLSDLPAVKEASTIYEVLSQSDLIICGTHELEQRSIAEAIAKKPSIVIAEKGASPLLLGRHAIVYTGVEDVRKVVAKVLETRG